MRTRTGMRPTDWGAYSLEHQARKAQPLNPDYIAAHGPRRPGGRSLVHAIRAPGATWGQLAKAIARFAQDGFGAPPITVCGKPVSPDWAFVSRGAGPSPVTCPDCFRAITPASRVVPPRATTTPKPDVS